MAIFRLYSKRLHDAAKSGVADVYRYDKIPEPVRVQVKQIALDGLGRVGSRGDGFNHGKNENDVWVELERIYLRERGLESISKGDFAGSRLLAFMRDCSVVEWLDLLELICFGIKVMGDSSRLSDRHNWQINGAPDEAIDEINYRLREGGVGYQIEDGRVIRVDSEYVHAEVIKPALALLSEDGFEGPREEFLAAHGHYRAGEHRQAVAMAANALESTFKAIFDKKGWEHKKGARISDLVKVAKANKLWPDYMDGSFDQLVATLQSGLPKVRDNDASHGQGATPKVVPGYVAAYALHLAASKIVFIAEAAK
ncbi:hypothetical protein K3177_10025 [Qipengyuania sp. GH25]|uniref:Abortive infection protein-like C-terminal domain-containing protein n=1 Tax=Qipengyuania pacifica TaxID=2860199 RepID=A0ABS7JFR5_9SPHN|nr:hypothetical protein [Qipengyuania aerophila]MBX7488850.1 hypothetical protein [Qipengyuania aerophila]